MKVIEREVDDPKPLLAKAKAIMDEHGDKVMTPVDVAQKAEKGRIRNRLEDLDPNYPVLDIGVDTVVNYIQAIREARTVICNGPMGMFEEEGFAFGTREVFSEIGKSKGYTLLGGGHTGVVARSLGIDQTVNHISTGGGSLIQFLSGGEMPVIEALKLSRRIFLQGEFAIQPEK
jgi:phosphoglycerate kinase